MIRACFYILLPMLILAVSGCANLNSGDYPGMFPVGTRVHLLKPLTVRPGQARVFIQNGKVTGARNEYAVFCDFELRALSEKPQVITPDDFLITAVRPGFTEVVMDWRPRWLASSSADYSPAMISRYFYFRLGSDRQPGVMRLACYGGFDDPPWAYPPRMDEIRDTLAGVVDFRLP